jgi:TNF receptor-associated protein 1
MQSSTARILSQLTKQLRRSHTRPSAAGIVSTFYRPLNQPSARSFATQQEDASTGSDEKVASYQFEAETTQLLDIVINSLYTDKDVFLRELISNAADALEKLRYVKTAETDKFKLYGDDDELEISISIDTESTPKTITIQDNGIGMSKEQMIENLGTIARSGSKAFLQDHKEGAVDIIGKFGVGFYSAFMVASKISVTSRSADASIEGPANVWTSEGVGSYDLSTVSSEVDMARGTKIVLELREEHNNFANDTKLQGILKTYSNFVPFPIQLAGNRVNTVQAIWASTPSDVSEEQYNEFYRYISNAFDEPMSKLHFRADVPLDLKALFYVPTMHSEKYGMGRMEPGVSLYSRKVLIDNKPENLLPEWLRFVKGVVDSEDLPLNISRESMQDSALIQKIGSVLTRRFLRHLEDESKKDAKKYNEFFLEFGHFLKEGVVTDFNNKANIAKLLRFESSSRAKEEDVLSSFDDYISRCPVEQNTIYYLCAPSRELAEASPYYEIFKRNKTEVLFLYTPIDEFVMGNL